VDSRGAAEYLRALILTNTIADYLPDEQSGRSASLPALVRLFSNSLKYI
jgi:ATP-dependent metalloprotease